VNAKIPVLRGGGDYFFVAPREGITFSEKSSRGSGAYSFAYYFSIGRL